MNCKKEFIEHTEGKNVKCAILQLGDYQEWQDEENELYLLNQGYTPMQYEQFLNMIDFRYDNGYGGQELFGFIWYQDGTWSERGEYDGSEWWGYKEIPNIPKELNQS